MSRINPRIPGDRAVNSGLSTGDMTAFNSALPKPRPLTTPTPTPKPTSIPVPTPKPNLGNYIQTTSSTSTNKDRMVRLKFKTAHPYASYPGILNPLSRTGGLIWPYRPSIEINRSVNYDSVAVVHSMQDFKSFRNNSAATIIISGQFSAQTFEEGLYMLAAFHFLETASLMSFGTGGAVPAGMPPPVLSLSAYGPNMLDDIPVVLDSFIKSLPPEVDYINVNGNDVPTLVNISAMTSVMLAPEQLRYFSLDAFAAGSMQSYI